MNIVLLDSATLGSGRDLSVFERFGDLKIYKTTNKNEVLDRTKDANIILTNKVLITKEVIDNAKNLKLICIMATGMNNVDLEYAKEKNIIVKNAVGYSTNSVTEHTFALLFSLIHHVNYYDNYVKNETWVKSPTFVHIDKKYYEIKNKNWGIIGLGNIGKNVANIALAFGAKISYYSTSGANFDTKYTQKSLNELLQTSDIVSIHAPLNDKTKNLISANELNQMKKNAILLNLGRGGIINEKDLKQALDEEKIYAGIDVIEAEPMSENNPLLGLKNKDRIIYSPHIAWASDEAVENLIKIVAQNIKNFLNK